MPFESQSLQVPNLLMPSLYGTYPASPSIGNPLIQDHPIQTSHFVLSAGRVEMMLNRLLAPFESHQKQGKTPGGVN